MRAIEKNKSAVKFISLDEFSGADTVMEMERCESFDPEAFDEKIRGWGEVIKIQGASNGYIYTMKEVTF